MVNRRNRAFDEGDIQKIAGTYHEWKRTAALSDIKGSQVGNAGGD
jgi:type I restriction enzyme M protein